MKLYYSSQLALNPGWTFKLADNILIGQITDDTSGACYNVYRYVLKFLSELAAESVQKGGVSTPMAK